MIIRCYEYMYDDENALVMMIVMLPRRLYAEGVIAKRMQNSETAQLGTTP